MNGDDDEFEYPDTAGYPDGTGTLPEDVDDSDESADDSDDDLATELEGDLERFALADEEDDEGV
ncbi:hypothetical protein [Agromyces laixinhei]|uniref:hypothetical protein n=1 Tax=Agromyces laixinhei TaxID=2585717 RepID=UPI001116F1CE|nr:hypothetical protein [Agromyces laixinhei]